MSANVIVPFLYELRGRKLKIGAQEAMSLAAALSFGLHDSSLDGFYHVARALCVHRKRIWMPSIKHFPAILKALRRSAWKS